MNVPGVPGTAPSVLPRCPEFAPSNVTEQAHVVCYEMFLRPPFFLVHQLSLVWCILCAAQGNYSSSVAQGRQKVGPAGPDGTLNQRQNSGKGSPQSKRVH